MPPQRIPLNEFLGSSPQRKERVPLADFMQQSEPEPAPGPPSQRALLGVDEDPGNLFKQARTGITRSAKGTLEFAKSGLDAARAAPGVIARSIGFGDPEVSRAVRSGFVEGASEFPRALLGGDVSLAELAGAEKGLTRVENVFKIGGDLLQGALLKKVPTPRVLGLGGRAAPLRPLGPSQVGSYQPGRLYRGQFAPDRVLALQP